MGVDESLLQGAILELPSDRRAGLCQAVLCQEGLYQSDIVPCGPPILSDCGVGPLR